MQSPRHEAGKHQTHFRAVAPSTLAGALPPARVAFGTTMCPRAHPSPKGDSKETVALWGKPACMLVASWAAAVTSSPLHGEEKQRQT